VHHIIEKLGGQVGVESELGQGTFFFTLPANRLQKQPIKGNLSFLFPQVVDENIFQVAEVNIPQLIDVARACLV
jgi:hypothetical protein